jgi:hypothetical protein
VDSEKRDLRKPIVEETHFSPNSSPNNRRYQIAASGRTIASGAICGRNAAVANFPAEDLVVIAQRMLETNDPTEKKRLEEELTRGFYGD